MVEDAVRIGLVGVGRIGRNHAEILARHTPGVVLQAIADPDASAVADVAEALRVPQTCSSLAELLSSGVDGVVIAAASTSHAELIVSAAAAGVPVFCEKPAGMSLAELDRAAGAVDGSGVVCQVGFNRRFAPGFVAARRAVDEGRLGSVQLLRSTTRDPRLHDPSVVPPWTIFTRTLIHDFDTLNWLNPGARAVRVFAQADALIRPDFRGAGLLDTALVTVAFDNGALAVAEASFQAAYGYDVRAEVFGSGGLATAGHVRRTDLTLFGADGISVETSRSDTDLLQDSYRAEFSAFVEAVRTGVAQGPTLHDARAAFAVAQACIDSITTSLPIHL